MKRSTGLAKVLGIGTMLGGLLAIVNTASAEGVRSISRHAGAATLSVAERASAVGAERVRIRCDGASIRPEETTGRHVISVGEDEQMVNFHANAEALGPRLRQFLVAKAIELSSPEAALRDARYRVTGLTLSMPRSRCVFNLIDPMVYHCEALASPGSTETAMQLRFTLGDGAGHNRDVALGLPATHHWFFGLMRMGNPPTNYEPYFGSSTDQTALRFNGDPQHGNAHMFFETFPTADCRN